VWTKTARNIPINAYGPPSAQSEDITARFRRRHYGWQSVIFRIQTWPMPTRGRRGEFHRPETHLIRLMWMPSAGNAIALDRFWHRLRTPDCTCISAIMCHVCDLSTPSVGFELAA